MKIEKYSSNFDSQSAICNFFFIIQDRYGSLFTSYLLALLKFFHHFFKFAVFALYIFAFFVMLQKLMEMNFAPIDETGDHV